MGRIKHNAIVVTSGSSDSILIAWRKALDLFEGKITTIVEGVANGYFSFLIVPDGSKEGWKPSDNWDEKRDNYFDWANETGMGFDCIEIRFGGDDYYSEIVRIAGECK